MFVVIGVVDAFCPLTTGVAFVAGANIDEDGSEGFSFSESSAAMMVLRSFDGSLGAEDLLVPNKDVVDFFGLVDALLGTIVGGLENVES